MPLDEHIEGRHGEGLARLKIGPAPVHDLLQMADERQHREHRLHPVRSKYPNAFEFIPICGRRSRGSGTWRTRSSTSVGCGSTMSTAVPSAAASSKTGSACGRKGSTIWLWNSAGLCVTSG